MQEEVERQLMSPIQAEKHPHILAQVLRRLRQGRTPLQPLVQAMATSRRQELTEALHITLLPTTQRLEDSQRHRRHTAQRLQRRRTMMGHGKVNELCIMGHC